MIAMGMNASLTSHWKFHPAAIEASASDTP
jgi:hypothetical protein